MVGEGIRKKSLKESLSIKRIFLWVQALLLIVLLLAVYGVKVQRLFEKTRVFEIKHTEACAYSRESKNATLEKHYMIIKPPEDLRTLKTFIEDFQRRHLVHMKHTAGEVRRRDFELYFYRESKRLPRDWQPNEGYLETDRLEHHRDDCIAMICWSDNAPQQYYSVMEKSAHGKDYGSVIREIDYIDDRIVDEEK